MLDLALTPAIKVIDGEEIKGFNVSVGGKVGSGGLRLASPLGVFVRPEGAASLCSHVALLFRDHGSRRARNRARLAFLVDAWGVTRFRASTAPDNVASQGVLAKFGFVQTGSQMDEYDGEELVFEREGWSPSS